VYPVPITSSTAGQDFHVGILPLPSGASAGFPVTRSGTNQSALRYQSGSVLMIGPGLEALFSVSQGLFDTNLIFFVSTSGRCLYIVAEDGCTIRTMAEWESAGGVLCKARSPVAYCGLRPNQRKTLFAL